MAKDRLILSGVTLIVLASTAVMEAQRSQIPYVTATSLRRGAFISHESSSRIVGDEHFSHSFVTTDGICAIKIQLRTLGRLSSPYEVQCFFCAKDPSKNRYIYDAVKVLSAREFDDLTVVARDLFAGSETKDKTQITTSVSGTIPAGQSGVGGYATLTLKDTKIVPGSDLEGWIVRVLSAGYVVRMDASLQELKTFAEREAPLLDSIAAKLAFSQ